MIKIANIKIPADVPPSQLSAYLERTLDLGVGSISALQILKRSVDARRKRDVSFVYSFALSVQDERDLLVHYPDLTAPYVPPETYCFPYKGLSSGRRPVIVGLGPAGLFAALSLAEAGLKPVILERGKTVEARTHDVASFWDKGQLSSHSNVQYGEGGAGTFSDGKLTTGIGDLRIAYVLDRLIEFGAPEDIRYLAKPHIGTDKLRHVVRAMREHLQGLGCDFRFEHRLSDIAFENDELTQVTVESPLVTYTLPVNQLILAPGNSARDTFKMLERAGVRLSPKSFSVGVRIEHRQRDIDIAQYGTAASFGTLPASDYKLAVHLPNGRTVYSFCVCPGGYVTASSSGPGQVVTNGMSEYARDGENCNGGLLVTVTPADFDDGPLSGIHFQEALEHAAFAAGGSNYKAPAQRVGDFMARRSSQKAGTVRPTYRPGVTWCNLWETLPEVVCQSLAEALPLMERKIKGFASPDAVLTAVETRSSCPVRIDRDAYKAIGYTGLYPCGEGAGYAGGIMSAAVDGLHAAEALCSTLVE